MTLIERLNASNDWADRALGALASPLLLITRCYVAWQFLKSGWLKLTGWDTTLFLFQGEYHVPGLPPELAAVAGTAGELLFPALLVLVPARPRRQQHSAAWQESWIASLSSARDGRESCSPCRARWLCSASQGSRSCTSR